MNKSIQKENDMENKMFCYQCEQTAGCTGCTGNTGVCGKSANTARLQDELTGALIGLARATEGNEQLVTEEMNQLVLEGLFTTITNVNFNDEILKLLINKIIGVLKNKGYTEIVLYSGKTHKKSWKFYDNLGFERVSNTRDPNGEPGKSWRLEL